MSLPKGFTEADVPDQTGRCFVVTGANTGIGFEVARVLALRGARVILACRDAGRARQAIQRIAMLAPSASLAFLPLDLADLNSVRHAAELARREPRIDGLINNAGVMMPPFLITQQGFEFQFGVNHLGTFAFTSLLLPKMSESPHARVVVTSSLAHRSARIDWEDFHAEGEHRLMKRYGASKLANALFAFELDRRLQAAKSSIIAIGCHPGFAATELGRHHKAFNLLAPWIGSMFNSAARGAWPALHAATGPVKPGGYYGPNGFLGIRGASAEASRSTNAVDPVIAQRLWAHSINLSGINPGLPPGD